MSRAAAASASAATVLSLMARPSGCACTVDGDCATGLKCNGRTCQALRKRGEFCVRDSDCGSDATGSMTCLPSKNWCGPLPIASFCDFNLDCLSGICSLGRCSTGDSGQPCHSIATARPDSSAIPSLGPAATSSPTASRAFATPSVKTSATALAAPASWAPPERSARPITLDGDCATGLSCVDCGGGVKTCRTGGLCS
jgi:hypothetical protein